MGCGSSSATATTKSPNLKVIQKKSGLSMKFIQRKYEEYRKFDKDGKISKSQFVDLMTDSDDKDLKHFLEQMFKAFDTDKSGNMTFDELMMMVGNVVKGSTQDRLRAVFHICDEDKSGRIEKGELVDTFENLSFLVKDDNVSKDSMRELAEEVFEETDSDKNGHLEKDEFIKAFATNHKVENMIKLIFVGVAAALVID